MWKNNITIHAEEAQKDVVLRLANANIEWKIDSYLSKIPNRENISFDIHVEKTTKWKFNWKIILNSKDIDLWKNNVFERNDFIKLDDLINHLFAKIKIQLSKK